MRTAALLASLLVAALGPFLIWDAAQRARGFEGELFLARPHRPAPPRRDELLPGLRRESYGEKNGILHQSSRVDGTLHALFRGQNVPNRTRYLWSGWIDVPVAGRYGFELRSDDGSHLRLDGRSVVFAWGEHRADLRSGWVDLEEGLHALDLDYYQSDGSAEIGLYWRPPGGATEHVPARVLFHERALELPGPRLDVPEVTVPPGFDQTSFPGLVVLDQRANLSERQRVIGSTEPGTQVDTPMAEGSRLRWVLGACRARGAGPHRLTVQASGSAVMILGGREVAGSAPRPFRGAVTIAVPDGAGWMPFQLVMDSRGLPDGALSVESDTLEIRSSWALIPPDSRPPPAGDGDHIDFRHDRHLAFEDPVSLHASFLHRWSVARLGHPAVWPVSGGRWKGWLHAAADDVLHLSLKSTGQVQIRIGDFRLVRGSFPHAVPGSLPVRAGWNEIEVEWRDPTFWRELQLHAGLGAAPLVALGSENIRVTMVTERGRALALGSGLAALFVLLVWLGGGPASQREWMARHRLALMAGLLVLLAAGLRLHRYEERPGPTRIEDEVNHHLLGRSLLELGLPVGWDFRDHYATIVHVPFHGRHYKMVVPLVFYPPAFSVIVATVAGWAGYDRLFDAPLHVTRLIPIALSLLTLLLIPLLARRMGVSATATFLGMMHFATFPFFVVTQRLVKEENLVAFLYSALLLVVIWDPHAPGPRRRHLAGFLILLGLLAKQTAVALPALAVFLWWRAGHRRAAGLMLLYGLLGIALFVLYGCATHLPSFLETQSVLAASGKRFDALVPLLSEAKIVDRPHLPTLMLATWIFTFMTLASSRRDSPLTVAILLYLVAIWLAYEPQRNYGWYRLPLFPFLSICWGIQAERLTRHADPVRVLLFVGLVFLPALEPFALTFSGETKTWLRAIALFWLAPSFLATIVPPRVADSLRQTVSWTLLAAIFLVFTLLLRAWPRLDPFTWPPDPGGHGALTLDGWERPRPGPVAPTLELEI